MSDVVDDRDASTVLDINRGLDAERIGRGSRRQVMLAPLREYRRRGD